MGLVSQPRPQIAEKQPPQMQERGRESMSPVDHGHARQQSNKDELLLNLLRQANQAPKPTPAPHPHDHYGGRGMFSQEEILNRGAIARNQMVSPQQQPDLSFVPRRENG
ncbi:MAG: hypothetical protein M1823_008295, partial [Watsoniomyces obsoletus]